MYAVVETQWHQYILKKWDNLDVPHLKHNDNESKIIEFDRVLCIFDDNWNYFKLWYPFINWAKIICKKKYEYKWNKTNVIKFKTNKRYHRNYWFKQKYTSLEVNEIKLDE